MSTSLPPPSAPDLETIFDVEGGLEPYILAALAASGIIDPERERSTATAMTPRVEVKIRLGACIAKSKRPAGCVDPRQSLPSAWKVTFEFDAVTDRKVQKQAGAHGKYRGKVRALAGQFFMRLNPFLPYHRLESMTEMGTTTGLENAQALTEDISRILFQGDVVVRDTAWPAGV